MRVVPPVDLFEHRTAAVFVIGVYEGIPFVQTLFAQDHAEEKFVHISIQPVSVRLLRAAAAILSCLAKYTVIDRYIGLSAQQNLDVVLEYIDEHYSERITVADLCKIFHYSRSSLFMHFKNELNQGVTSYINNLRLEKSKALLKEHSVKEVATLVGFESTNYFSRAFRKKYGVSPSAYFNKKAASPPSNTD